MRFDDIYARNRGKGSLQKQQEEVKSSTSLLQSIFPFFSKKAIATKYDSVPKQVDDVEAPPPVQSNDRNHSDIK